LAELDLKKNNGAGQRTFIKSRKIPKIHKKNQKVDENNSKEIKTLQNTTEIGAT